MQPQTQPILTISEVARVAGVTRNTIHRWLEQDADPLKSHMIGKGRRVVYPEDLRTWAASRGMLLTCDPSSLARPWPREATEAEGG